ncbi:MAG TPA: hypothetical protein VFN67_33390 [Polyangiales bacterium]|jgi:hypothetical protein|nr:hypothetical protein [Polyangiales bacterium]
MSTVAPELLTELRTRLAEGERVAWAQSPIPEAFEKPPRRKGIWDAVVILGGGYATLGSIYMALRSSVWYWLALPISLILIGVAGYFGMQALERRKRYRLIGTAYAVTTKRALILRVFPNDELESLDLETIADVALTNEREYFADLKLVGKAEDRGLVFEGVDEAKRALMHIQRVLRDPKAADAELAHSEAYFKAMRSLARPAS